MANQIAMLCHCERGDEVLVGRGQPLHAVRIGRGLGVGGRELCVVGQRRIVRRSAGARCDQARRVPLSAHAPGHAREHPQSRGRSRVPAGRRRGGRARARDAGSRVHLDGARIWNAAVATGSRRRARGAGGQRERLLFEGPRRAGRFGDGRHARVRRARAPLSQDARRRHAPGRRARGRSPARARTPPRAARRRPCARAPRSRRACHACPACAATSRTSRPTSSTSTWTAPDAARFAAAAAAPASAQRHRAAFLAPSRTSTFRPRIRRRLDTLARGPDRLATRSVTSEGPEPGRPPRKSDVFFALGLLLELSRSPISSSSSAENSSSSPSSSSSSSASGCSYSSPIPTSVRCDSSTRQLVDVVAVPFLQRVTDGVEDLAALDAAFDFLDLFFAGRIHHVLAKSLGVAISDGVGFDWWI